MISSGADEYISRTVAEYSRMLFKIAYTVLNNAADSEDIVQEVFIKLINTQKQFIDKEHEKAWLIRVTINMSRNLRKKLARCDVTEDIPKTEKESHDSILEAVTELPEKYSTVIHLYYYEGYSIKEISQILHIPSATVGTRLKRGRSVLKTKLTGDDYIDKTAVQKSI